MKIVSVADLEYDVYNRRVLWANAFRPWPNGDAYERAMAKYGNFKRLEDDIREYGVAAPLITAPYENNERRVKLRVYGGNRRLCIVNKINRIAQQRGEPVPIPELQCIVYDLAQMEKHKDRLLYSDHQIPPKRWPLIQRVETAKNLERQGRPLGAIQDEMMLVNISEVKKLLWAADAFSIYQEITGTDITTVDTSKVSFFVEAAGHRSLFDVFRNFKRDFATWVANGLFVSANVDVRNLAKIVKLKEGGYEFLKGYLDRKVTLRHAIGKMGFDEVMRLGLTPTLLPNATAA